MTDSVNNIVGSYENYLKEQKKIINNNMDKDMFFKILVTQLQNQDPMNPMEDRDFIAQLAQFTSLEQMEDLSSNSVKMYAYSMVGKYVEGVCVDKITGDKINVQGKIDSVVFQDGIPVFSVGEHQLISDNITKVYEKAENNEKDDIAV